MTWMGSVAHPLMQLTQHRFAFRKLAFGDVFVRLVGDGDGAGAADDGWDGEAGTEQAALGAEGNLGCRVAAGERFDEGDDFKATVAFESLSLDELPDDLPDEEPDRAEG